MTKICIIDGNHQYHNMFLNRGWEITNDVEQADVLQFCGGADVTPSLYGDKPHPYTTNDYARDKVEKHLYQVALRKPKLGICRGAQFLWVMNGGRMFQHVEGHATGNYHPVLDLKQYTTYDVSSTHHQMMMPTIETMTHGRVAAIGTHCNGKQWYDKGVLQKSGGDGVDIEAAYFSGTKTLCFQPHPEFSDDGCREYYFTLIRRYFPELEL